MGVNIVLSHRPHLAFSPCCCSSCWPVFWLSLWRDPTTVMMAMVMVDMAVMEAMADMAVMEVMEATEDTADMALAAMEDMEDTVMVDMDILPMEVMGMADTGPAMAMEGTELVTDMVDTDLVTEASTRGALITSRCM